MTGSIPIKPVPGTEFFETEIAGVDGVRVTDRRARQSLGWDRFVRLKAVADQIASAGVKLRSLLDVGGYDGALALFVDAAKFHLLDPETTGGNAAEIPVADHAYQCVVAVDLIEHIEPSRRALVLEECARVSSEVLVLNYPASESRSAQELVLRLTGNSLIRQHVEWELPDSGWVMKRLEERGFVCTLRKHSSVAVWVGQYILQNLAPEAAALVNEYLIAQHAEESFDTPLYHLISARRCQ
ncbi:MAG: class I SAM-dependent methyltransferase [Candidatus Obscuribacterales bacterium]